MAANFRNDEKGQTMNMQRASPLSGNSFISNGGKSHGSRNARSCFPDSRLPSSPGRAVSNQLAKGGCCLSQPAIGHQRNGRRDHQVLLRARCNSSGWRPSLQVSCGCILRRRWGQHLRFCADKFQHRRRVNVPQPPSQGHCPRLGPMLFTLASGAIF